MALVLELGTEPATRKPLVNGKAKIDAEMMEIDNTEMMGVDEVDEPDGVELSGNWARSLPNSRRPVKALKIPPAKQL